MALRNMRPFKTAAFDVETDPFKAGRTPEPFCAGFLAEDRTELITWGEDCIEAIMAQIMALDDRYLIYVHAGGRFDFAFLWDWIEEPVTIVGDKILEFAQGVTWRGAKHVWRDSFKIMPVPLREMGDKIDVDYATFERHARDGRRDEIVSYLRRDLDVLLSAACAFRERFEPLKGRKHLPLTMGALSLREITRFHRFEPCSAGSDQAFRPYYFGGRNQVFRAGVMAGPWQVWDCNSHYGFAMSEAMHPTSDIMEELRAPPPPSYKGVWFAHLRARNNQWLPWRDEANEGALRFDIAEADFYACSHELAPAIARGDVVPLQWHAIWRPLDQGRFDRFVSHWMQAKVAAEQAGDRFGRTFAKCIIAAASGKFGQDPDKFKQWALVYDPHDDARMKRDRWEPASLIREDPERWLELWNRPAPKTPSAYQNVATAASITSASRRIMAESLRQAVNPIYCDTDSVICSQFDGWKDPHALGAWKLEATADYAAIAGKKLYCLYNKVGRKIVPVKWASKGDELTPEEIIRLAKGGKVEKTNLAPVFSLVGVQQFTSKVYRKTVDNPAPFR